MFHFNIPLLSNITWSLSFSVKLPLLGMIINNRIGYCPYCCSFMLLQMTLFFFLWLTNIPLYIHVTSLQPHGLQHARPLCPSPSPEVCSSSCPLHQCWYPAISSSDAFFSFCPQSFPGSGTYPMSQLFALDGQNIGISAQHQSFQWMFSVDFS